MLALQGHRMRLGPIVLAAGLQPGFNIPNVFILELALGLLVVRGASSLRAHRRPAQVNGQGRDTGACRLETDRCTVVETEWFPTSHDPHPRGVSQLVPLVAKLL